MSCNVNPGLTNPLVDFDRGGVQFLVVGTLGSGRLGSHQVSGSLLKLGPTQPNCLASLRAKNPSRKISRPERSSEPLLNKKRSRRKSSELRARSELENSRPRLGSRPPLKLRCSEGLFAAARASKEPLRFSCSSVLSPFLALEEIYKGSLKYWQGRVSPKEV